MICNTCLCLSVFVGTFLQRLAYVLPKIGMFHPHDRSTVDQNHNKVHLSLLNQNESQTRPFSQQNYLHANANQITGLHPSDQSDCIYEVCITSCFENNDQNQELCIRYVARDRGEGSFVKMTFENMESYFSITLLSVQQGKLHSWHQ